MTCDTCLWIINRCCQATNMGHIVNGTSIILILVIIYSHHLHKLELSPSKIWSVEWSAWDSSYNYMVNKPYRGDTISWSMQWWYSYVVTLHATYLKFTLSLLAVVSIHLFSCVSLATMFWIKYPFLVTVKMPHFVTLPVPRQNKWNSNVMGLKLDILNHYHEKW